MTLNELYQFWGKLINLLEAGASIYDEDVDTLVDAIEDGLIKRALAGIGDGTKEVKFEVKNG